MDTSPCCQRSMMLSTQRHTCSCTAFSRIRFREGRLKLNKVPLRQQSERWQQFVPQHAAAHTPLQTLHVAVCNSSTRCTQAVRTPAHEPSTADMQLVPEPLKFTGAGAAALLAFFTGGTAIAAEAGDVEMSQGPDLLTTVLFSATALALLVLTIGVVYLSATSFFDKRAENEARKKFDEAQKSRELQAANVGKPKVKRRRTQDELSRGGGKGFGS